MFPAEGAELLQLHSVRMLTLVAGGRIVTILAIFASQSYDISHLNFLTPGIPGVVLFDDAGNNTGTDCASTFTDSKT
jgi:hypothetical protein